MKRIGLLLIGVIALVIGVALVRTLMVPAPSDHAIASLDQIEIDELGAANRLGEAIRIETVSTQFGREDRRAPFVEFRDWVTNTYPALHRVASREIIGDYSLFYTWPGTDATLEPILLMSHMDVVPIAPGTEAAWDVDPDASAVLNGLVVRPPGRSARNIDMSTLETLRPSSARTFTPDGTETAPSRPSPAIWSACPA